MLPSTELITVSDKEFDAVFRTVLEEEHSPFEEEAWQQLRTELDVCRDLISTHISTHYLNSN